MSWPLRALMGPAFWAFAFSLIYAAHGAGCAWDWPARPAPLGDLHHFTLIALWLVSLVIAAVILWLSGRHETTGDRIAGAGGWIGLVAVALTLFPVMGLSTCGG